MVDLLIQNACVYDGSGGKPYRADVAIQKDRICAIGKLDSSNAARTIDGNGLDLLPGLIDTHTHSDGQLMNRAPRLEAIRQGITTEIIGSCGIGLFPLPEERKDYLRSVRGIVGNVDADLPMGSVTQYTQTVGASATNYAMQLAHSPLRIAAVGNLDVPMTEKKFAKMEELSRQAFEAGACAFSTGLAYYPAAFSATEELVRICAIAAEYDVPFTAHLRSVQNKFFPDGLNPIAEVIEVAKRSGVHLHFSHHKTRKETAGQVEALLAPLEEAMAQGVNITADFYPYPVGCGYVAVFLPLWIMEGDVAQILERLADPTLRPVLEADIAKHGHKLEEGIFIHAPRHPEYLHKTFPQVAQENNETIPQMLIRFLLEEELDGGYMPEYQISEEVVDQLEKDYAELLRRPYYMVGSDTLPGHNCPHPRTFDTFPKLLKVGCEHGLPLELLANRMCANPADVFHLTGRGRIREGNFADLILLNTNGHEYFDLRYMVMNGQVKIDQGQILPQYCGQALKSNDYRNG